MKAPSMGAMEILFFGCVFGVVCIIVHFVGNEMRCVCVWIMVGGQGRRDD